jgi:hypothetical protein
MLLAAQRSVVAGILVIYTLKPPTELQAWAAAAAQ